jgi:hypothetical protein
MLEAYLEVLELGYYEVTFAFEGLSDAHVWERPGVGLLSVGELAGHVAYWEAVRLAGGVGDIEAHAASGLEACAVKSPLIDHRFRYHTATLETAPSDEHRAMTAEQVLKELLRVHAEAVAHLRARAPEPGDTVPGHPAGHTYGEFLKYLAFHVAYHTGQMFSARHLLGETTPDN